MGSPQYSFADQALINAAAEISVMRVVNIADERMAMTTIRDVLPYVRRETVRIGQLAEACDDLLQMYNRRKEDGSGWSRAQLEAGRALQAIFRERHAGALAAFQAEREKVA